jgi:protein tyrosine phosphatase (PTP) superfamily phosphohydrolase (DUF442 family)
LVLFSWTSPSANEPRQSRRPAATELEPLRKADAPIVLCIDDKPSVGGQPSDQAYAKAAASGFRSVLTLRARTDGVDLWRERLMVEKNRLRYFNLPVLAAFPRLGQLDEFLRLVRDNANHPMLINCAFAERVAPYMMMFNLVERGWTDERAVDEASKSGLRREVLQELARNYLKARANHKANRRIER